MRRTITAAAFAAVLIACLLTNSRGRAQSTVNPGTNPAGPQTPVYQGPGFLNNRAAMIDSNGLLDGVSDSTLSDCVYVNGTGGPCATGAVTSAFGRTGVVVATTGDYSFGQISGTATADQLPDLAGYNGLLSLTQLAQGGATTGETLAWSGSAWVPASNSATVASVFGRTGTVTAATGDYSFSQISGSATAGQLPSLSALNGSLGLSQLAQGGASAAQCMVWSGTDWGPANCSAGGGGSGGAVTSVFGRTGIITAHSGDYGFSQLSGSATAGQLPNLDFLNGTLLPSQVARDGATTGQVIAWNGTAWAPGPPGAPGANFSDDETPTQVDALDYTLAYTPNPAASLQVFYNGLLLSAGVDYTLSTATITFASAYSGTLTDPLASGDVLVVFYRY